MAVRKYLDEVGLRKVAELVKEKIDSATPATISNQEVADLFDVDDLDQEYVSNESIQEALEETEY